MKFVLTVASMLALACAMNIDGGNSNSNSAKRCGFFPCTKQQTCLNGKCQETKDVQLCNSTLNGEELKGIEKTEFLNPCKLNCVGNNGTKTPVVQPDETPCGLRVISSRIRKFS